MKIKLAFGITKQLEKEFLISNFEYFKDYFQSSIYKNEDEANLGIAHGNLAFDWTMSGVRKPRTIVRTILLLSALRFHF